MCDNELKPSDMLPITQELHIMESWRTKDFVSAGLCDDEMSVIQDAVRALLVEKPQLRLEVAIQEHWVC